MYKNVAFVTSISQTSKFMCTVSLSRVWLIDEMNPGNDSYSSPDLYMGYQKAPKIEKFN